jgi:hypothetical protein
VAREQYIQLYNFGFLGSAAQGFEDDPTFGKYCSCHVQVNACRVVEETF